jgi:hypothetical protein
LPVAAWTGKSAHPTTVISRSVLSRHSPDPPRIARQSHLSGVTRVRKVVTIAMRRILCVLQKCTTVMQKENVLRNLHILMEVVEFLGDLPSRQTKLAS